MASGAVVAELPVLVGERRSGRTRKHDWQRNSSGRRGTMRVGPSARSRHPRPLLRGLLLRPRGRRPRCAPGAGRRAAPRRRRGAAPRRGRRRRRLPRLDGLAGGVVGDHGDRHLGTDVEVVTEDVEIVGVVLDVDDGDEIVVVVEPSGSSRSSSSSRSGVVFEVFVAHRSLRAGWGARNITPRLRCVVSQPCTGRGYSPRPRGDAAAAERARRRRPAARKGRGPRRPLGPLFGPACRADGLLQRSLLGLLSPRAPPCPGSDPGDGAGGDRVVRTRVVRPTEGVRVKRWPSPRDPVTCTDAASILVRAAAVFFCAVKTPVTLPRITPATRHTDRRRPRNATRSAHAAPAARRASAARSAASRSSSYVVWSTCVIAAAIAR